jgi:hypothetical protein
MGQRDDIIDTGIPGQKLRLDPRDRVIHGSRNALHRRGDPKDVLRTHGAIGIDEPLEGIPLQRGLRRSRNRTHGKMIEVRRRRQVDVPLMHPRSARNALHGMTDHHAIAKNGRTSLNLRQSHFMCFRDRLPKHQSGVELRAGRQSTLVHNDGDIIGRMNLNEERAYCRVNHGHSSA